MIHLMCRNYDQCHNRTAGPQKKKCWRLWQLCGICAVKAHPEEYTPQYVRTALTSYKRGKQMGGSRSQYQSDRRREYRGRGGIQQAEEAVAL